jgi:hypothetical protein
MDNFQQPVVTNMSSSSDTFSAKNILIFVLIVLLMLSFLGINILHVGGNIIEVLNNVFGPLITQMLSIFGYTTGTLLNTTSDVVTSTAKTGIEIAGGTVKDVGNILIDASDENVSTAAKTSLDKALTSGGISTTYTQPKPDTSENPIQKPISSGKVSWCLVGEYKNKRGCIEVTEQDKCLSGQLFPDKNACLAPAQRGN